MAETLMQRSCAGLKEVRYGKAWLQASILFSVTWTIGGVLDSESRVKFDTFLRSLLTGKNESYPYPTTSGRWECHLPADGTVYDYVYEYKQRGQWRQWAETIRNEVIPEDKPLRELIIPTVDTARFTFVSAASRVSPTSLNFSFFFHNIFMSQLNWRLRSIQCSFGANVNEQLVTGILFLMTRYSYLLELSLLSGTALLLVGPTGTGKSLCVREKMNLFNEDQLARLYLTFTAQTSSAQVQVIVPSLRAPISETHLLNRSSFNTTELGVIRFSVTRPVFRF